MSEKKNYKNLNPKNTLHQFLHQHPQTRNQPWLLAVSGGIDSVVLSHLCVAEKLPVAIAHCNFNLRGEESLRDKTFAEQLANSLQVPFFYKDFNTNSYVAETGKSIQVAARELRYQWFQELATEQRFKFIATAHHADDNAETVVMHLFRGSGIKGLRGILPVQENIIRPLLHAARKDIEAYAAEHHLQWVEDSSNQTDKYTRNYLRHRLFPLLQEVIPHSQQGFEKSIQLLTDTEILYNQAINQHRKKLIETKGEELHIPVLKLAKLPAAKTILYEILQPYGFVSAQLEDAFHLLEAESGKYIASATHRLIRNRRWLILAPLATEKAAHILIEKKDSELVFQQGALVFANVSAEKSVISEDADTALLDAAEISYPLLLRPWQQGDYFYPLGMPKKKKLSRFLIDKKLSATDKEKVWVIESKKKILWVIGLRIDHRFRMTESTKQVLKITFKSFI